MVKKFNPNFLLFCLGLFVPFMHQAPAVADTHAPGIAKLQCKACPIKVGYIDGWPAMYTEDGQAKGPWIEGIRTALTPLGRPLEFIEYPVKRLYILVQKGEIHIAVTVPIRPRTRNLYVLSSMPVTTIKIRLFAAEASAFNGFTSIYNLESKSVLVLMGLTLNGLVVKLKTEHPAIKMMETTTLRSGFAMLRAGRADYLLHILPPVANDADKASALSMLPNRIIKEVPLHYIVQRSMPDFQIIFNTLEARALN